jgi:Lon protease-like protein
MQKTQIALFPLQVFLLPGETATLHIFEERYRQLLEDCQNVSIGFGIPYTSNGFITEFGCVVELKRIIKRHPNGSSDIEIEAVDVFKVDQFYMRMGEKLYPGGDVILLNYTDYPPVSENLMRALEIYVKHIDPTKFPELLLTDLNAFDVARILNIGEEEKIKLAKAGTQEKRERLLMENIRFLEAVGKQSNSVKGDIFLN